MNQFCNNKDCLVQNATLKHIKVEVEGIDQVFTGSLHYLPWNGVRTSVECRFLGWNEWQVSNMGYGEW